MSKHWPRLQADMLQVEYFLLIQFMFLKYWQLIESKGHVSRNILCKELSLGEGSVKTLVKHLKAQGIIESTKAGTTITPKGKRISEQFLSAIPAETMLIKVFCCLR